MRALRTIDVSKKHAVSLTFLLDEEVTPQLFAQKVARACRGGTLRPGECILVPETEFAIVVTDELGVEWRPSKRKPRRAKASRKRKPR